LTARVLVCLICIGLTLVLTHQAVVVAEMWSEGESNNEYCSIRCSDVKVEEFEDELFDRLCVQQCPEVRMLATSERHFHRPVSLCQDPATVLSLLPYVAMIVCYYETFRQLVMRLKEGKLSIIFVVSSLTSLFPIFYAHDMIFLYLNDQWFQLFIVQIYLTVSMDISLVLKWMDICPSFQVALHAMLIMFNIVIESDTMCIRNLMFLLDNIVGVLYGLTCECTVPQKLQQNLNCRVTQSKSFWKQTCVYTLIVLLTLYGTTVLAIVNSQRLG
jgi:hypothetical protein